MASEDGPPITARVIAPDEGRTVALYAVGFRFRIDAASTGGALSIVEVDIPPGTLVKPHRHTLEDEYSIVLSGRIGVRLGDDIAEATAGSYLQKPRGIPHAIWNASDEPARIVEILSPGGFERYFEELAPILASQQGSNEVYYALAERYGITIENDWIEDLERTYGVKL